VDTLGLLLVVAVTSAAVDDAKGAQEVLGQVRWELFPRLKVLWADSKYHNYELKWWVQRWGWYRIEVVTRPDGVKGFVLLPKRWVVERTFAWLGGYRRLSKDYEKTTAASEARIKLAAIHTMLKRLKGRKADAPSEILDTRKVA